MPAAVPEIVVTASRYELVRDAVAAPFYVDQRAIEQQPDFGDDPLRALASACRGPPRASRRKPHLRGGELNETAVILNGQRLLDPFHIRDYQSMFSAIDVRAIDGMEVYTGGFPVRYGDSMGALVLVDALDPHETRHSEVGLSVLNTSALSAGTIGDGTGSWLVSARRSNLEDVVHERLGEPSYYDFFGELGHQLLGADPRIGQCADGARSRALVTEADPTEFEQSVNDTRNNTFWVHWQQQWSNGLVSSTTFASSAFHSTRAAETNDPEKIVAMVSDRRDIGIASVRQDWTLDVGDAHTLSFGRRVQPEHADYDYTAVGRLLRLLAGVPGPCADGEPQRDTRSGRRAVRRLHRRSVANNRCDDGRARPALGSVRLQRPPNERHASPRLSVRHELDSRTALRWSLGRYFQSQGLHELQVEDGVTTFQPAQRAEQAVIGVERRLGERYLLTRRGLPQVVCSRLRPRFENLFDPLAILPELEPDRARIAPEEATARGLELSVAYADPDGLRWWASYVRARATDVVAGETVPRSWDQRDAAQLGVGHAVARLGARSSARLSQRLADDGAHRSRNRRRAR